MRAGLVSAWLAGMGIITWRFVAKQHQPPIPGTLLSASGLFALLALLAESEAAAPAAVTLAWAFDLAALLNILPGELAGPAGPGKGTAAARPGATVYPTPTGQPSVNQQLFGGGR